MCQRYMHDKRAERKTDLLLKLLQGLLNEVCHGSDIPSALVPGGNDSVRKLLQLRVDFEGLQSTCQLVNKVKRYMQKELTWTCRL